MDSWGGIGSVSGKMCLRLLDEIREGLRGKFTLKLRLEDERHYLGGYSIQIKW